MVLQIRFRESLLLGGVALNKIFCVRDLLEVCVRAFQIDLTANHRQPTRFIMALCIINRVGCL